VILSRHVVKVKLHTAPQAPCSRARPAIGDHPYRLATEGRSAHAFCREFQREAGARTAYEEPFVRELRLMQPQGRTQSSDQAAEAVPPFGVGSEGTGSGKSLNDLGDPYLKQYPNPSLYEAICGPVIQRDGSGVGRNVELEVPFLMRELATRHPTGRMNGYSRQTAQGIVLASVTLTLSRMLVTSTTSDNGSN
jgi:hypothetical protein